MTACNQLTLTCLTFIAAFASQSLLTGLGSVQFISNLVFVMLVLREQVPLRYVLATVLIVAGNVILVVFGNKSSPKYTVTQLAALYRQDSMAAYMIMAYGGGKHQTCCASPHLCLVNSLLGQCMPTLQGSQGNITVGCSQAVQAAMHIQLRYVYVMRLVLFQIDMFALWPCPVH